MFSRTSFRVAVLALTVTTLIASTAALGARPKKDPPPCTISPSPAAVGQTYVVSVSGLPTGVPINLWITDSGGNTSGSPLGSTGDGSFALEESASSAGNRKYSFSGATKNNPDTTVIYSSCSVEAY
jgi:hypothetical protein